MIDFIQLSKFVPDKDSVFLGYCQLESKYSSGWEKYILRGCKNIELLWHPSNNVLRLKGSLPYYMKGHNLTFDTREFIEAINHIEKMIQVQLWDAVVEKLEYGVIMTVEEQPKRYIRNHTPLPSEHLIQNEKPKDKGSFRWWEDRNVSLKMYDANKNAKTKVDTNTINSLKDNGWNFNSNCLKFEVHYKCPEILNNGTEIFLYMLAEERFQDRLKEDLYSQYKRLQPHKAFVPPISKKCLKSSNILALTMVEAFGAIGYTVQIVKDIVYEKIRSIPNEILSKSDKDARRRQIRSLFESIQEEHESKWDLSQHLEKALL